MATAKKSFTSKALQSHMAKEKKTDKRTFLEWQMACYTNPDPSRGGHVWSQEELCELYSRSHGGHCGATKRTHTTAHDGEEFKYIVVKRYKKHGWDFRGEGTGNQLIDEIKCWERLADTDDADFLCPILKYFKCKSDKVEALDELMKERVLIIAQKADYVSDMADACDEAERRNKAEGRVRGKNAYRRRDELKDFADRMGWRDVEWNPGNSGVIFDYDKNCWKAVFIDYAL